MIYCPIFKHLFGDRKDCVHYEKVKGEHKCGAQEAMEVVDYVLVKGECKAEERDEGEV